jgi:hypothetical protein
VTEGESASFEAAAEGVPTPTVQWQVSTNGGTSWSNVSGDTSDTLNISDATTSESGNQYRAVFTNVVEAVGSTAATLTVTAKQSTVAPQPPPPPPPPPRGEVKGFTESSPLAKIAGTSLTVSSSGALTIKVSCPSSTTCIGTATLRTLTAVSARARTSAAKKAKKSILTLATASFTVAGGQVKSITLHVSRAGLKLLARSHVLNARATVVAHDLAGVSNTTQTTVTLRAAKRKSHH